MATAEKPPFSWHGVEGLPDLERLRLVLDTLPDEEIVAALEAGRGRGRNDYPVGSMWRALIAGVVFRHASIQSLLRELGRNPALLELCGFDPLPFQGARVTELRTGTKVRLRALTHPAPVRSTVPSHWNFSRFLTSVVQLEDKQGLVSAMVESLRASLFEELPDFGRHLGCDGKAIESHSTGRVAEDKGKTSDPDADWGKHETSGVDSRTGKIWKKVKLWFGCGLHLIADTHYGIPVAFEVTRASRAETRVLPEMLKDLFARAPEMAGRCDDFSADRAVSTTPRRRSCCGTSGPSGHWSTRAFCGRPGRRNRTMTRRSRSRGRCFPTAPMSSSTTSAAGCPASAPRPARSARWPSRASRPSAASAAR